MRRPLRHPCEEQVALATPAELQQRGEAEELRAKRLVPKAQCRRGVVGRRPLRAQKRTRLGLRRGSSRHLALGLELRRHRAGRQRPSARGEGSSAERRGGRR